MPKVTPAHETPFVCASGNGLNVFESNDATKLPPGDAFSSQERGVVTRGVNLGIRAVRASGVSPDAFNSGCANPHYCVETDDVTCTGPIKKGGLSGDIGALYSVLQAPYGPKGFDYSPPPYAMGWKDGTENSVTGWDKLANGTSRFASAPWSREMPCSPGSSK